MKNKTLHEKREQIDEYYIEDYHYNEYDVKKKIQEAQKKLKEMWLKLDSWTDKQVIEKMDKIFKEVFGDKLLEIKE